MAGYAYVVWERGGGDGRIWFSTNNPAGIAEEPMQQPTSVQPIATVVRNVLFLAECPSSSLGASCLLDVGGRQVMALQSGANDVSRLSPGVYFVRSEPSAVSRQPSAVTKVVVTR